MASTHAVDPFATPIDSKKSSRSLPCWKPVSETILGITSFTMNRMRTRRPSSLHNWDIEIDSIVSAHAFGRASSLVAGNPPFGN